MFECSMKIKKTHPKVRTVCVSKVYDLNSDLFTILAFEGT